MSGHLRLSKDILNWEWMDDSHTFHVFLYLLLNANYVNCKYRGYDIKRGDVIIGLEKTAANLGLSVRNIRTVLNRLKSTGEVTTKTTNKFTIVTICNFERWQDNESKNDKQNDKQSDIQLTNNRQTTDIQLTTIEEIKEIKKEIKKEYDDVLFSAKSEFLRVKEDMQKEIDTLKGELEDVKKDKKKRAKPIPKALGGFARVAFEEFYKEQKGLEYDWTAKDARNMKLLLQRIQRSRENREQPLPCDDNSMLNALKIFLSYIKDPWLLEHLDVANLNSKYNEIVASARQSRTNDDGSMQQAYATLTPVQEARIYGIDEYQFSMMTEQQRDYWRKEYRQKMLDYIRDNE